MITIKQWDLASKLLGTNQHVILWGPPATGKTYAAMHQGRNKQDTITITITDDTSAADLVGYYINTPAGFKWMDGPITEALRTDSRLVINEIDHANGDAEALLYAVLDNADSFSLRLISGETIKRPDNFQCIATSNRNPTEYLREGMQSRFVAMIHINEPHPVALQQLHPALANAAKGTCNGGELTLRHFLAFTTLQSQIGNEAAAQAVFGERAEAILDSIKVASA